MSKEALQQAVDKAGGPSKLARAINARLPDADLKQQNIWYWLNEAKCEVPPPEYCLAIEAATGVSRYVLRPDVYGHDPCRCKDKSTKKRRAA